MRLPLVPLAAGLLAFAAASAAPAAPAAPTPPSASAAPAPAAAPAAPVIAPTIDELRATMLASDSIMVAHVDVAFVDLPDSTGRSKTTWRTKRLFLNQVKSPWMKRFVANFLPEGAVLHDELCPTPAPVGGSERPWMLTALWITKDSRGQAYLDFSSMCAFAGIAGHTPQGLAIGARSDSLLALFTEALYADTTLRSMKLGALSAPGAVAELPIVLARVAPTYPKAAREAGVEGTVMVNARVGRDGHVVDAKIAESIGLLDIAALSAVRQWTFKPAKAADGQPVEATVRVPVTFSRAKAPPQPSH